jgi:hypothetical protein
MFMNLMRLEFVNEGVRQQAAVSNDVRHSKGYGYETINALTHSAMLCSAAVKIIPPTILIDP